MNSLHIKIGDIVTLKKAHPCGENLWKVTRMGADVGMQCQGCKHVVLLDRVEFERRLTGRK